MKKKLKNFKFFRNLVVYSLWFADSTQRRFLRNAQSIKNSNRGQKCLIVLSGPSIGKQDLKKEKFDHYFFVNRGFLHPDYKSLNPKTHVFIDPKLLTGEWDFGFVQNCIENSNEGEISFIFSVDYLKDNRFVEFHKRNKNTTFFINNKLRATQRFWSFPNLLRPNCGAAVFGAALNTAIYLGFEEICFTGFDANGLCYEIIKQDSHFYGQNVDNLTKTTKEYSRDLRMMADGYDNLNLLAAHLRANGMSVFNCTNGGALDMFERKSLFE